MHRFEPVGGRKKKKTSCFCRRDLRLPAASLTLFAFGLTLCAKTVFYAFVKGVRSLQMGTKRRSFPGASFIAFTCREENRLGGDLAQKRGRRKSGGWEGGGERERSANQLTFGLDYQNKARELCSWQAKGDRKKRTERSEWDALCWSVESKRCLWVRWTSSPLFGEASGWFLHNWTLCFCGPRGMCVYADLGRGV